jgi:hypothetical protein
VVPCEAIGELMDGCGHGLRNRLVDD